MDKSIQELKAIQELKKEISDIDIDIVLGAKQQILSRYAMKIRDCLARADSKLNDVHDSLMREDINKAVAVLAEFSTTLARAQSESETLQFVLAFKPDTKERSKQ